MNYLASAASAILVIFSMPFVFGELRFINGGLIGWFSLIPLFFVIFNKKPLETFKFSLISTIIWYIGLFFWAYNSMHYYGGISLPSSIGAMALMSVATALMVSAFIALGRWLAINLPGGNMLWIPLAWTTIEWIRNYFPVDGFPWANIAVSQWQNLPILQTASIAGIYGVTFIIVLVNMYFATALKQIIKKRRIGRRYTIATAAVLLAALSFGYSRITAVEKSFKNALLAGIVQPNIPQSTKWNIEHKDSIFKSLIEPTRKLNEAGADLIIWPESALQYVVPSDVQRLNMLSGLVSEGSVLITGLLEKERVNGRRINYNSVFAIDNAGQIEGKYRKTHLAPFGEYVPYKKVLFFVDAFAGHTTPGLTLAPIETELASIGPLICYEDIFPEISRALVKEGAQLLVTMTNDAWFDLTSESHQHLAMSVFRSVETDRYMLRSANTGISAVISPKGHLITATPLFEQAVIMAPVFIRNTKTFYVRFGDWLPYATAGIMILGIAYALIFKRKGCS